MGFIQFLINKLVGYDIESKQKELEQSVSSLQKEKEEQTYSIKPASMVPKDVAHNFLRHIRNAFSHGKITVYRGRHNSKYYSVQDFNTGGSQTMSGKIRSDLLWGMIEK